MYKRNEVRSITFDNYSFPYPSDPFYQHLAEFNKLSAQPAF